MPKKPQPENLLEYETQIWHKGLQHIAGVDEVGRGALAGPLVVGAVILNKNHLFADYRDLMNNDVSDELLATYQQIKDSKLLTPKRREALAEFIKTHAISYSIEIIEPAVIDKIGIMPSTQLAFFNAVRNLEITAHHVLTDTFEIKKLTQNHQTNIKSGDRYSITIAAASIIAKVYRDALMVDLHERVEEYKKYHFHKHKGYGTKLHKEAIFEHGPCNIHRKCFEPIKSMLG